MSVPIQNLAQFSLAQTEEGYLLEIAGDGGGSLILAASSEQVEAIVAALDALLSDGEDAIDDAG